MANNISTEKTDQLSLDFQTNRGTYELKLSTSMFMEDISISRYRLKDEFLNIKLKSEIESKVIDFLSNDIITFNYRNAWGRQKDLKESILNLLETFSSNLAYKGYCVIEKIRNLESKELTTLKIIRGNVEIKKNSIVQIIPKDIAEKVKSKTKIIIPKNKCYVLKFPEEVCTTKEYLNMLKQMAEIDSKDPMFSILNPSKLNNVKGYDVMKHREKLDLIMRKTTIKTSWHHREQYSRDRFSQYYSTLRDLNFKRTKIIILNHIFEFIKFIVDDIFTDSTLNLSYSKNLENIDEIISKYKRGDFTNETHLKVIKEYSI